MDGGHRVPPPVPPRGFRTRNQQTAEGWQVGAVRRCTGYDARCGFRFLSFRHLVEHHLCRCLHGSGYRSEQDWRSVWHVGAGPFPTELFDETGAKIRAIGHEYGAVTGRERRCGWIDLVALRYAIMVSGVTKLIMMKSDVLDDFPTIKACTAYQLKDGTVTRDFPYDISEGITPIYEELPGWQHDLTTITSEAQFPQAFSNYIAFLEKELETPITIVSVGPDREQTIER